MKIFISHSAEDSDFASEMAYALKNSGVTTFWDDTINPGQDWRAQIREAISQSDIIAVLIGQHANENTWISYEVGMAEAFGKRIVVFRSGGSDPMSDPEDLRSYNSSRVANAGEAVDKLLLMNNR